MGSIGVGQEKTSVSKNIEIGFSSISFVRPDAERMHKTYRFLWREKAEYGNLEKYSKKYHLSDLLLKECIKYIDFWED